LPARGGRHRRRLKSAPSADRAPGANLWAPRPRRDELRAGLARDGTTIHHLIWDYAVFERRQFVRTCDDRLVLLGPRFLFWWTGEGLHRRSRTPPPTARTRPGRTSSRRCASRASTRQRVERYVVDVARRSHTTQERAGIVLTSGDVPYTGRDGTESRHPDLVLDFGTDLIASRSCAAACPPGAHPIRAVRHARGPRRQGHQESQGARGRDADPLAGLDPDLLERVWPVVVAPSTILQTDVTLSRTSTTARRASSPAIQRSSSQRYWLSTTSRRSWANRGRPSAPRRPDVAPVVALPPDAAVALPRAVQIPTPAAWRSSTRRRGASPAASA
jgi:hypothetical protein